MKVEKSKRIAIRRRFPVCCYCRQSYGRGDRQFTVDHLLPVHRGGTNRRENLVGCCKACNVAKGCRTAEEWLAELMEAVREIQAMQAVESLALAGGPTS